MVRGSMIEELSSDYVRTARAKGITETASSFPPRISQRADSGNHRIVPGLQFGSLLAGTIVTETIFSWPGIGRLAGASHRRARLSVAARLHPGDRVVLRRRKSPHGFDLCHGRSTGAPAMIPIVSTERTGEYET